MIFNELPGFPASEELIGIPVAGIFYDPAAFVSGLDNGIAMQPFRTFD